MSEPFIGEIRMFAGTYAPKDHAFCTGQLLAIRQFTALFSIIGNNYGGDGKVTFGLPDLQGRFPVGAGQGPGLKQRDLGEMGGSEMVTLTLDQMAVHNHAPGCNNGNANQASPENTVWARTATGRQPINHYASTPGTSPALNSQVFASAGANQAHNNVSPYLAVNFIIALQGIFPPRP